MSEWLKEHAWKSDLFTRADAHQNPSTHVRSISSRYNKVLRDAPVSDDVHGGFLGACDTVLTQSGERLRHLHGRTWRRAACARFRHVVPLAAVQPAASRSASRTAPALRS